MWFVYILKCADNTLYTGVTKNLETRESEHNGLDEYNKGAKYTRTRRPVKIIYSAEFSDRSSACKEEYRIKKLKRLEKLELISTNK